MMILTAGFYVTTLQPLMQLGFRRLADVPQGILTGIEMMIIKRHFGEYIPTEEEFLRYQAQSFEDLRQMVGI